MSYGLNSIKGDDRGTTIRVIKGDTRSLDYSSHRPKHADSLVLGTLQKGTACRRHLESAVHAGPRK